MLLGGGLLGYESRQALFDTDCGYPIYLDN
jgi:hypothetical protein